MQLDPLNFSKIRSEQIERNAISPGRKRTKTQNTSSILSGSFFNENVQLNRGNDQLIRPRSNDIFILEKAATHTIASFSSSDSEKSDLSSSEKPLKKVVSWTNDLKQTANPFNKYDDDAVQSKNRTHSGTVRKRSVSLSEIKSVKTAICTTFDKTEEQFERFKSKNKKKESLSCKSKEYLSPCNTFSNNEKLVHVDALKKIGLPYKNPDANRLLSFKLGKIILLTDNTKGVEEVKEFIEMGFSNPQSCGQEMWRSMGRTQLFCQLEEKPLVDGTPIILNDDERDTHYSICMGKMLNLFFRHVSQSDEDLIPFDEFGDSQISAGLIGLSLAERLKAKVDKGMNPPITRTMQLMLGLGYQKLVTTPAFWTIPEQFNTVRGPDDLTDDLIVTEYGPTFDEILKPLHCDRQISIFLKKDGGLEYIAEQPITFKDRATNDLLGTCRMKTTLLFDQNMNYISKTHETKAAEILFS